MKWEYLRVLLGVSSTAPHDAPSGVWVINDTGQLVEWRKQPGDKSHTPVVSRLLKKLGDDGWELVGIAFSTQSPGGGSDVLYFKRPQGQGVENT